MLRRRSVMDGDGLPKDAPVITEEMWQRWVAHTGPGLGFRVAVIGFSGAPHLTVDTPQSFGDILFVASVPPPRKKDGETMGPTTEQQGCAEGRLQLKPWPAQGPLRSGWSTLDCPDGACGRQRGTAAALGLCGGPWLVPDKCQVGQFSTFGFSLFEYQACEPAFCVNSRSYCFWGYFDKVLNEFFQFCSHMNCRTILIHLCCCLCCLGGTIKEGVRPEF